jgi:MoxR-like ATPase
MQNETMTTVQPQPQSQSQSQFPDPNAIQALNQSVQQSAAWIPPLRERLSHVLVGQTQLVDRLLASMLANGHVLLEGVPGLAKTLALKSLASLIHGSFKRIQFTPDMLPADIVGTEMYNPQTTSFETKKGVVFANFILADEINRAPAKVQSALLEAMQERQVTIGDTTYRLPDPFLVMATQNPIEQEGTYPLPEAQIDRFMMKVVVDYPSIEEERMILDSAASTEEAPLLTPIVDIDQVTRSRKLTNAIYMDNKVKDYIVALVYATRDPQRYGLDLQPYIRHGASPRATISLTLASKANAFISGRGYVTPQDVKAVAMDVMRHRILVTYEADAEGLTCEHIVSKILQEIPVP